MAAKSANLTLEAEQAAHAKVGLYEKEGREEHCKLQDEIMAVEMRERTQTIRQEFAREGSRIREDSRGRENARFQEAFLERMQLELAAFHQRARDD